MKLAIIWSRSITDKDKVYEIIKKGIDSARHLMIDQYYKMSICLNRDILEKDDKFKIDTIISWWAIWVDSIAKEYAKDNNLSYIEYSPNDADYSHLQNRDKPLARNTDIAKKCDVLLCIHDWYSKGILFAYDQALSLRERRQFIYIWSHKC